MTLAATQLFALACFFFIQAGSGRAPVREVRWEDVAAMHIRLQAGGITQASFASYVGERRRQNVERVREGDLDHLVFYFLQSTTFTKLLPIEPALSAKTYTETGEIPLNVRPRAKAFLSAIRSPRRDLRLSYVREIANASLPEGPGAEDALLREYVRVMKFVYEKEFVAQKSDRRTAAVAELYRTRGLSTDTAVEAGFLVHEGLAVLRAVDPGVRIRRVLIVGPGLDLAPRTGFSDARPPESYQPWAVIDALLSLGLARADDLEVVGADINPRVVRHLRRARTKPPALTFVSEIRESEAVSLSQAYREYVASLGEAIGTPVRPAIARTVSSERLDIVTERLTRADFDLIVATNILPYFDDTELLLALTNITSMLAPHGVFIHNEARPIMEEYSAALHLPLEQARTAVIANVRGAPPLIDSVFLHRK